LSLPTPTGRNDSLRKESSMLSAKILIADDEKDIRELLKDFLEGEGHHCFIAANAYEAFDIFNSERDFDIIMSDICMPGKTGLDLLSEIKSIDPDVMVVMISALKDIESAITAMSRGAHDYVSKPFKLNEVAMVARKALEKRRLILENREYQHRLEKMVEARTGELRHALSQLDRAYYSTLRALVIALDTRDTETQGHSIRVVRYTIKLASLMGINDGQSLKIYEYGALLHDIGKIGIPDAILRKPGRLTKSEWVVMKKHPVFGYKILQDINFLEESSHMVLHHHECFQGQGYPTGLKGQDIPLSARIFNVADAFDAMTSDRPYRRALTFGSASKELMKSRNIQFDPAIVDAFHSIDLEWWIDERRSIEEKLKENPSFFQDTASST